ncbi:cytochrome P450 [Microtetraspora fusca]|uniref:Cytochrome P450 n=1 Tax=Microtetraspora fusca TaxID=1997 RepID=A0ABW6V988_MICFU
MIAGDAIEALSATAIEDEKLSRAVVILNRGAGSGRLEDELAGSGWRVHLADVPAGDLAGCVERVGDVLAAPDSPDRAVLLGYGEVGRAALELADRHPERVAAVVAMDPEGVSGAQVVSVVDPYGSALTFSAAAPSMMVATVVSFLKELARRIDPRMDRHAPPPARLRTLTPVLLNDSGVLGRMREAGPVHRIDAAGMATSWVLTGHRAATATLADPGLVADVAITPGFRLQSPAFPHKGERDLITIDGGEHVRLRRMVGRYLTPKRVEVLRPRMQREADALLDALPRHEEIDLIARFALPLPVIVLCELLGVPRRDRGYIHEWLVERMRAAPPGAHSDIDDYLRDLIELRKARPSDDLLGWVVEAAGKRLDAEALVAAARLLMVGGHRAPTTLLANGVAALLRDRDQWTRLVQDPGLLVPAVEELLRFVTPFPVGLARHTSGRIEVGGRRIPEGDLVAASLVAANRDPSVFADPDVLDVGRVVNPHLSFGYGHHYCLGAALARAQAQIAIGTLATRFPRMDFARGFASLHFRQSRVRYLLGLPVVLEPDARRRRDASRQDRLRLETTTQEPPWTTPSRG